MEKILQVLFDEKYKIRFSWLGKKDYARIDYDTRTITINLGLFLASVYVHEYHHGEDKDVESLSYNEEEVIVKERENIEIKRAKERDLRRAARYIEKEHLLPSLIRKHMPELMRAYEKKVKKTLKRKRKNPSCIV